MSKVTVVDGADHDEERLRELAEKRTARFEKALRTTPLVFDREKVDKSPDEQLEDYREHANVGLRAILAKAAADEAEALARK